MALVFEKLDDGDGSIIRSNVRCLFGLEESRGVRDDPLKGGVSVQVLKRLTRFKQILGVFYQIGSRDSSYFIVTGELSFKIFLRDIYRASRCNNRRN